MGKIFGNSLFKPKFLKIILIPWKKFILICKPSFNLKRLVKNVATIAGTNLGAITSMTFAGIAFTDYVVTNSGTLLIRIPTTATIGLTPIVISTPGGSITTNTSTVI